MSEMNNNWNEGIEKKINSLINKMGTENSALYSLDMLIKIANRVTTFSSECEECKNYQQHISSILVGLGDYPKVTIEQKGNYVSTVRRAFKHLKKQHRLVRQKKHLWRSYLLFGVILGVLPILWVLINLPNMGSDEWAFLGLAALFYSILSLILMPIGMGIGYVYYRLTYKVAEKEGRVI